MHPLNTFLLSKKLRQIMHEDEMLIRRSLTDVRAVLTILAKQTQTKAADHILNVEDGVLQKGKSSTDQRS